ncbi:CPBP family glutamic-type intramembrane protease [Streptomyces apocyni]|uniref:CPBP family glutamic-type intramembrane protease n=1 Tax=Streptomyces apocyni TaxID=2654677 RepID=UPI0012EA9EA7|nr:CPBP family glutamic-type intramembrane protease [Streptomyces apocyni]
MTISPDFTTAALAVAAVLVAYLAVGEPWLGRRMYGSLERRRDSEPRALVRYYRVVLGIWCALGALAVAVLALSPGAAAGDLGLGAPDDPLFTYALIPVFLVAVGWSGWVFRQKARDGRHIPGLSSISAMLPRTPGEHRYAVAVGLADGVIGEFVYRGLLIALGVGVLGLNVYVAAALALAVYALAGLYQGRKGVLLFAFFGAVATLLYLQTGSLLLPVVFHAAIAVRDLVMTQDPERTPSAPLGTAALTKATP